MPSLEGQPTAVTYLNLLPNAEDGTPQELQIERVTPSSAIDVAADVQALLRKSYLQLFTECEPPIVSRQSVETMFDPNNMVNVADQARRIIESTETQSSQYWVASVGDSTEPGDIVGLIKTTPSLPRLFKINNMYVNDIAVDPGHQGQGIGKALLRTAIRFGGYEPEAKMVCDVFTNNSRLNHTLVNELGMIPRDRMKYPFVIGGVELPQRRMIMRNVMDIGKLATRLEKRYPELTETVLDI